MMNVWAILIGSLSVALFITWAILRLFGIDYFEVYEKSFWVGMMFIVIWFLVISIADITSKRFKK